MSTISYDPGTGYDEVFDADGRVRPLYAEVMDRLAGTDLDKLARRVAESLEADGVYFGGDDPHPYCVDPVPRLLTGDEWDLLARGVAQRTRVLEAFVGDVYGERRAVRQGIVPERVLEATPYLEKDLVGCPIPTGGWIGVAGFDLVRGADGRFRVLEDNLRTPAGAAFAEAANRVTAEVAGLGPGPGSFLADTASALRRALERSAPDLDGELVLVSDGEHNSAWFEHRRLAEAAGLRLALIEDLRSRGGRVELADGTPVRAFYRRSDSDSIRSDDGRIMPLAATVLDAVCENRVGMVNRYGGGVADDKMIYTYVDDLTRLYLGEEPILPSVTTYDLLDERRLADADERLHELVAKPRDGYGGQGVVVGPAATDEEIETARAAIHADPEAWIVQEVVELSTLPAVVDGRLEPRHVDLRVIAVRDGDSRDSAADGGGDDATGVTPVRGGLTRVALEAGSMVVNSSRRGGAKATWVV
ncbi:MAG: circularly permuted type 2 ATP-grasp protein [Nocardioides sp.]|uniref:circularly permuted type 2 ATP-grasp protein n=1 Tax=Nocardioides sp. TaxID=35761 RepID=UPI0039E664E3